MTFVNPVPERVAGPMGNLRHRWGWFVAAGILIELLGLTALVLTATATIASVLVIGTFMVIAGIGEIVVGFGSRDWSRFFLWVLAGIVYVVAGASAIVAPGLAALVFTLVLGAGLVATGILRLVLALQTNPGPQKTALLVSALVTTLLGVIIVIGWPGNTLFVIGLLIGIDLVFYGMSWITFGLMLKRRLG